MTNDNNIVAALSDAMADAAEKAGAATLLVNARRRMPASGVAIAADLVLTADHAIEREDDIRILLPDGSELGASVAGRDPGSDLAVLRLERAAAVAAQPAERPARVGQIVRIRGCELLGRWLAGRRHRDGHGGGRGVRIRGCELLGRWLAGRRH